MLDLNLFDFFKVSEGFFYLFSIVICKLHFCKSSPLRTQLVWEGKLAVFQ